MDAACRLGRITSPASLPSYSFHCPPLHQSILALTEWIQEPGVKEIQWKRERRGISPCPGPGSTCRRHCALPCWGWHAHKAAPCELGNDGWRLAQWPHCHCADPTDVSVNKDVHACAHAISTPATAQGCRSILHDIQASIMASSSAMTICLAMKLSKKKNQKKTKNVLLVQGLVTQW